MFSTITTGITAFPRVSFHMLLKRAIRRGRVPTVWFEASERALSSMHSAMNQQSALSDRAMAAPGNIAVEGIVAVRALVFLQVGVSSCGVAAAEMICKSTTIFKFSRPCEIK